MPLPGTPRIILGIETSCDETAAAVVEDGRTVCSSVVSSQVDLHAPGTTLTAAHTSAPASR